MKTALETTMQGYDMIVAVTQNNINANLKFLYGAKGGIKTDIDIYIEAEDARLTSSIAPPAVKLHVKNQPHAVIFLLTLKRGSLEYWTGHGPQSKKHTLPIENWVVGFNVNLDLADVASRDLPEAVVKAVKNLGEGMFSVRQLFMDFQNANLSNWDPASTVLPESLQDDSAKAYFVLYMNEYMSQVQRAGHHILGYGIHVKNPNAVQPEAPSFPPTDLTFTTNIFMPNGVHEAAELDPGLDSLSFLMMGEHRRFPANPGPWFGNWVTCKDVYGTIAIARHNFINTFLLPKLAASTNLTTTLKQSGRRSVSFSTTHGAPFTVTDSGGTFSSHAKAVLASHEGGGNTFPSDHTWEVSHHCSVDVPAAGKTINVSGHSEVYYKAQVWAGIKYHALEEDAWQKSTLDWSVIITLDSIKDGNLNVTVDKHIPDANSSDGGNWLGKLEKLLNKNFNQHGQDIKALLLRIVDAEGIASSIKANLNTSNRFVFPGGQQFNMYDPVFNNERDLLANVRYLFY